MKRNLGLIRRYYFWYVYSLASGHLGEGWKLLVKKTESASRPRHRICSRSAPRINRQVLQAFWNTPSGQPPEEASGPGSAATSLADGEDGGQTTAADIYSTFTVDQNKVWSASQAPSLTLTKALCVITAQHFRKENADREKLSDLPKITKRVGV